MTKHALSISGGGTKSVISATFLTEMERLAGQSLANVVDVVGGTSCGALLGVGLDRYPARVLEEEIVHHIDSFLEKKHHFTERFKAKRLRSGIIKMFGGNDALGNINHFRALIPTYNLTTNTRVVFDSDKDKEVKIADALIASASAPLYFKPHKIEDEYYADGGIWNMNPVYEVTKKLVETYPDANTYKVAVIGAGRYVPTPDIPRNTYSYLLDLCDRAFELSDAYHYQITKEIADKRVLFYEFDVGLPKELFSDMEIKNIPRLHVLAEDKINEDNAKILDFLK